jgi:hypothetical protein
MNAPSTTTDELPASRSQIIAHAKHDAKAVGLVRMVKALERERRETRLQVSHPAEAEAICLVDLTIWVKATRCRFQE